MTTAIETAVAALFGLTGDDVQLLVSFEPENDRWFAALRGADRGGRSFPIFAPDGETALEASGANVAEAIAALDALVESTNPERWD